MRKNLKWLAESIVNGVEQQHAIWDVTVETKDNAPVLIPTGKSQKQEVGRGRVSKLMCNYFSFGLDARIGFGMVALLDEA